MQWHTIFGTKANVVTQSKTIYEQLELGVRKFDIRPKLVPSIGLPWSCGHGTDDPNLGVLGWQGGLGASIQDVVRDINRFTEDKAELIFLEVNEINVIIPGITGSNWFATVQGYCKSYLPRRNTILGVIRSAGQNRLSIQEREYYLC